MPFLGNTEIGAVCVEQSNLFIKRLGGYCKEALTIEILYVCQNVELFGKVRNPATNEVLVLRPAVKEAVVTIRQQDRLEVVCDLHIVVLISLVVNCIVFET